MKQALLYSLVIPYSNASPTQLNARPRTRQDSNRVLRSSTANSILPKKRATKGDIVAITAN
jgi:hypothetical protein